MFYGGINLKWSCE